ncbi:MAG: hypothetical protein AAFN92_08360 [Bacteroidota bacterium]
MPDRLHQYKGRDFRKFRIVEDGLLVEYKTLGRYDGYRLSWEEIDFDATVQGRSFDTRRLLRMGSVLLNVGLALWIVWLLWTGIRGTWWFYGACGVATLCFVPWLIDIAKVQRYKKLLGEVTVAFYYRPADEEEVDAFIQALRRAKGRYLRERFLELDELLPLDEQVAVVQDLYLKKMISREDLAGVMEQVRMRRLFED